MVSIYSDIYIYINMEEINMEESYSNKYTYIFYLRSLKEKYIRQEQDIDFILKNICEIDRNVEQLEQLSDDDFVNNNFYNLSIQLKESSKINQQILKNIDEKLCKVCNHQFVEDYIEGPIEQQMIRIRYCEICQYTDNTDN